MAAIVRLAAIQSRKLLVQPNILRVTSGLIQPVSRISTSKKNKDTISVPDIDTQASSYEKYKETDEVKFKT